MIAVIGCGNPNRSDDGVGSEVLGILMRHAMSRDERVRLLDAGTDGMRVMFSARGCTTLIIVDACSSGSKTGSIFEVPGSELERPHQPSITLHDFRWEHALFAGRRIFGGSFPRDVCVLLVEAGTVAFGCGLSEPVAAAAQRVVGRIEEMVSIRMSREELAP